MIAADLGDPLSVKDLKDNVVVQWEPDIVNAAVVIRLEHPWKT